jgi:hypothetical protein
MEKINSNELKIIGGIIECQDNLDFDYQSKRILWLIENELKKIKDDDTGWYSVYLDHNDNRYWELSYNFPEAHGGGIPQLRFLSENELKEKYQL